MDDWFRRLSDQYRLEPSLARALDDDGFAVVRGAWSADRVVQWRAAYQRVMDEATGPDKSVGDTTTRVHDFVNRGPGFDEIYLCEAVLAACCRTIGQPFKLSNMLGRTVHPMATSQGLHVDFARDARGWPMLGFIVMLDDFHRDNGATRFLPGSHRLPVGAATSSISETGLVSACGVAGSLVVYNGSVVHGHGPNDTDRPRRSIQGAYIRRDASGFGLPSRMGADTALRLSPLAKYLIAV